MKGFMNFGRTALLLGFCFCCTVNTAEANASLTPISALKAKGVYSDSMHIVGTSPDNRYLCAYGRVTKDSKHNDFRNLLYIFNINADNSIGKVNIFNIKELPRIEQLAFTPDSKSVVLVGKMGAKVIRLDIESGNVTTIMEHTKGQPGFRVFPLVLINNSGELLVQGYFYDEDGYCGPNTISVLDANKTGVEAFNLFREVDRMQQEARRDYLTFVEYYPRKDVGFMALNNGKNIWNCYKWEADKKIEPFDKAEEVLGFWGGDSRILYSVKRAPNSYDLVVYDAHTNDKIKLSEGRRTPYMYLFLSADGKTALFNDADDNTGTTQLYYAREGEGWEIKPLQDLNKRVRTGTLRIALDGSRAIQHSTQGLRIIDIK
ncbi:hypothetical protein IJT17_04815 [bacterium]|nr:hypothetical protein [bacterium]